MKSRHGLMTPKQWVHRLVALEVAWCLLLAACAVVGRLINFQFWPALMGWVLIGLVLMIPDSFGAPLPSGETVDVIGALRMLWWAALWPMRLFNK
jgi:hypothetical protein